MCAAEESHFCFSEIWFFCLVIWALSPPPQLERCWSTLQPPPFWLQGALFLVAKGTFLAALLATRGPFLATKGSLFWLQGVPFWLQGLPSKKKVQQHQEGPEEAPSKRHPLPPKRTSCAQRDSLQCSQKGTFCGPTGPLQCGQKRPLEKAPQNCQKQPKNIKKHHYMSCINVHKNWHLKSDATI